MKIKYLIIAIAFLGCSCEDAIVTGVVIDDTAPGVFLPEAVPLGLFVGEAENSSAIETVAQKPDLPDELPILIAKNPIDDNPDESESSQQPEVLPVIMTLGAIAEDSKIDDSLNSCAHTMCPMIYCENSLPPIPTQNICCQRCVTNPNCNTSACPKYKCGTYLIPANLTAGECCDRCAPANATTTASTKKPSAKPTKAVSRPKKNIRKPKKTRSSSSSSEEERSSSSSEQHDGKLIGCNIRPFNPKPKKSHSRLLRLLTEASVHFRHSHSHRRHNDDSESQEN